LNKERVIKIVVDNAAALKAIAVGNGEGRRERGKLKGKQFRMRSFKNYD
jgi:hypothetical protein